MQDTASSFSWKWKNWKISSHALQTRSWNLIGILPTIPDQYPRPFLCIRSQGEAVFLFRTTAGYRTLATGFSCHLAKTLLSIVASRYLDDRKRNDIATNDIATICEKSFRQMPRTHKEAGIIIPIPRVEMNYTTGLKLQVQF